MWRTSYSRWAELQEMERKLNNSREAEKELDIWFQAQSAVDPQSMAKQPKTPPVTHTEGRRGSNAEEWNLEVIRTCRRNKLPPKPEMPFQNLFANLQTEEERSITSGDTLELSKAT